MIIFNEKEYFNKLIENGFDKYINKRDLIILAKEWNFTQQRSNDEIKNNLVEFCRKWVENFNYAKYENLILSVIKLLDEPQKTRIFVSPIGFTTNELNEIMQIEDFNAQNLLFIIMCICKMYNRDNIYLNSTSSIKLKELCELAKIKLSAEKQMQLLHTLFKANVFEVSNSLKYTLKCLDRKENKKNVLEFEPRLIMVNNFTDWRNANFTTCQNCKKTILKTNNKIKYCESCAKIIKNKQIKELKQKKSK